MPTKAPDEAPSQDRPKAAAKKPRSSVKAKSAERETRLAEALRENLRRRKAGSQKTET
jgi:hypothetical protein